jgi:hypothetical protein
MFYLDKINGKKNDVKGHGTPTIKNIHIPSWGKLEMTLIQQNLRKQEDSWEIVSHQRKKGQQGDLGDTNGRSGGRNDQSYASRRHALGRQRQSHGPDDSGAYDHRLTWPSHRVTALQDAMSFHQMTEEVVNGSHICQHFLANGRSQRDLDNAVEMICRLKFLHEYTNYAQYKRTIFEEKGHSPHPQKYVTSQARNLALKECPMPTNGCWPWLNLDQDCSITVDACSKEATIKESEELLLCDGIKTQPSSPQTSPNIQIESFKDLDPQQVLASSPLTVNSIHTSKSESIVSEDVPKPKSVASPHEGPLKLNAVNTSHEGSSEPTGTPSYGFPKQKTKAKEENDVLPWASLVTGLLNAMVQTGTKEGLPPRWSDDISSVIEKTAATFMSTHLQDPKPDSAEDDLTNEEGSVDCNSDDGDMPQLEVR